MLASRNFMKTRIYEVQTPDGKTIYLMPDLDFSKLIQPK